MDRIFAYPIPAKSHPSYKEPIPAFETIKNSVTIMRGCFGGCTFCSITAHQGRIIQSRSRESVVTEIQQMAEDSGFKGTVSDIGGPTANMYQMQCTRAEVEAKCRRQSCVHPKICKLLGTDHGPLINLMRDARNVDGDEEGFGRQRYPHGFGSTLAGVHARANGSSCRWSSQSGSRACPIPMWLDKMKKPCNDDFEKVRRQVRARIEASWQEAVFGAVFYCEPSR